jgi:Strictosidine synthase
MCAGYFVQRNLRPILLPYGGPRGQPPGSHVFGKINYTNTFLQFQHGRTHQIVAVNDDNDHQQRLVRGPETVVFGNDGTLYILTEDANLVSLVLAGDKPEAESSSVIRNSTATMVRDLGPGRPLGGKIVPLGAPNPFAAPSSNSKRGGHSKNHPPPVETLYIADTLLGLTRIRNIHDPTSKLEIVVRSVDLAHFDGNATTTTISSSPMVYADDVAIGPRTGRVYFTDASDIRPDLIMTGWRHRRPTWDTLYASKLDLVRGRPTGRLLQYDPVTDQTTVLLDQLHFANGVAVADAAERYLIVAETFGVQVLRYDLHDGTVTTVVHGAELPGYVDGVDCSWQHNLCYAVMPSAIVPLHKLWNALPGSLSHLIRTVAMVLPRRLAPPVKKFGGVIEFDPTGIATTTNVTRTFLDPTGRDIGMLTGVTVGPNDGKLYLGSLQNKFVGVYDLE